MQFIGYNTPRGAAGPQGDKVVVPGAEEPCLVPCPQILVPALLASLPVSVSRA